MKKIFLLAILISGICSCSKNDDLNNAGRLSGIYTEIYPVEGRTHLAFTEGSKVIKTSEGSSVSDEFFYEIIGNKIKFTSIGNEPITTEHNFEWIDESSFEVENLYVSIPENPPVNMLFKK